MQAPDITIFALVAAILAATVTAAPTPGGVFTRQELKAYFKMQLKLYPKNGDLYRKLVQTFGTHDIYTAEQVTAIIEEKVKKPKGYPDIRRASESMVDSLPRAEVVEQLAEYEKTHPEVKTKLSYIYPADTEHPQARAVTVKNLLEALEWKYGKQSWYLAVEVRDVEENGIKPKEFLQRRLAGDPVRIALEKANKSGFKSLRIRQSWRDVLYEDDPSQPANAAKALKDLVGATLSYARDNAAHTDTWTAVGAAILPWEHNFPDAPGVMPVKVALAPSVSINRVDTNGDPKKEADSVLYRLGAYGDWIFSSDGTVGLQPRAAFVYATNTGHDAFLPGGELDLEPRWQNNALPVGFSKIILHKAPLLEDGSDQSLLDYQLRTWLHLEGGDVQDNGKSWDTTKGAFFRLGPALQLQVNAPRLILGKDFSITCLYSYLPAVSGSAEHQSYFSAIATHNVIKNELTGHKVSINLQYQKGGLNFTQEDVDTFTIGLGVLF